MTDIIAILLGVVLVNHFVLGRFPALCPLPPADAAPVVTARIALATIMTVAIASPGAYLMETRALAAVGVPELGLLGQVATVAIAVQAVWLLVRPLSPAWHGGLAPYRALVTFNATAISMGLAATRPASGATSAALAGAAAAIVFCALLLLFGGVLRRLRSGDVPPLLRGAAIGLVTAAIVSLAFAGLEGFGRG